MNILFKQEPQINQKIINGHYEMSDQANIDKNEDNKGFKLANQTKSLKKKIDTSQVSKIL